MSKEVIATGKTVEDAIQAGCASLGVARDCDELSIEVLETPTTGFLGFGTKPARVRVALTEIEEFFPQGAPAPKPAAEKPAEPPAEKKPEKLVEKIAPKEKPQEKIVEKIAPKPARPQEKIVEKIAPKPARPQEKIVEKIAPRPARPQEKIVEKIAPRPERREEEAPAGPSLAERLAESSEKKVAPNAEDEANAKAFLSEVLRLMDVRATVETTAGEDGLTVEMCGEDMRGVIDRHGETLDALQYLTSLVVNKSRGEYLRVLLDTENYRTRRIESLERLAKKLAAKAVRYRHNVTLEPMTPYERRIIHFALQGMPGVTTYSTGHEPNRRVVISPTGGHGRRGGRGGSRTE